MVACLYIIDRVFVCLFVCGFVKKFLRRAFVGTTEQSGAYVLISLKRISKTYIKSRHHFSCFPRFTIITQKVYKKQVNVGGHFL